MFFSFSMIFIEYLLHKKDGYPENIEYGIYIFIMHPKFGEVQKLLFHKIDFREEQGQPDKERFVDIDIMLHNKEEVIFLVDFFSTTYILEENVFGALKYLSKCISKSLMTLGVLT